MIHYKKWNKLAGAIAMGLLFQFQTVKAQEASVSTKIQNEKKLGGNIGLGDPFPGLLGINAAYNLSNDIRLTAGYAEVEMTTSLSFTNNGLEQKTIKAQTYGVGAQYLFTNWSVRPTAGLHAGYFSVSGDGDFSINGFNKSTAHAYSNLGFDWIAQSGFHLATGLNVAVLNGSGAGFYANAGYFF